MENKKVWEVINILRSSYNNSSYVEVLSGLFFIKLVSDKYGIEYDFNEMSFKDDNLVNYNDAEKSIIKDLQVLSFASIEDEIVQKIMPLIKNLSSQELANLSVNTCSKIDDSITPNSLINLGLKILDLKNEDSVLDLCSGYGLFLVEAFKSNNAISLHGREINKTYSLVSKIILYTMNGAADIQTNDVLLSSEENSYDKVFSHFPFILRLDRHKIEKIKNENNENFNYEFDTRVSSDWVFVTKVINSLKKDGKGIAVMADGPLYKTQDVDFRKALINSGYVEAIIQLPERLLLNTSIGITMLVLSKSVKRQNIKIIDASDLYSKGRRINELTSQNIDDILTMYQSDENFINIKEIKENNYLLLPQRYSNQIEINNPIKVGNFSNEIFRGVQLTAQIQDKGYVDDQSYDYQVLNLSDIYENTINYSNLQKVKLDGNKWDKYLIQDKDFVISAKGSTIKLSVVEINNNEKIIASGNLMVIRINQEIINPYYLKVFLDSPLGKKVLESVQTGSVVISIGKKMLEDMQIPFVDLEKQNEIASKYLAYIDEIKYFNKKLNKLQEQIENLFEDELGGE